MEKSKIFAEILSDVVRVCEISEEVLLSKQRDADTVDARHLLVYLLYKQGIYPYCIAKYINKRRNAITKAIGNFDERMSISPMLRRNYNVLKTKWGGRLTNLIIQGFLRNPNFCYSVWR